MDSNEPVIKYVTRLRNLVQSLEDIGEKVSHTSLMAKILGGLPSKFDAFVSAWDSVDSTKQNIALLEERLLKEESKLTKKEEEATAFYVSDYHRKSTPNNFNSRRHRQVEKQKEKENQNGEKSKDSRACYICQKIGHIARYCRSNRGRSRRGRGRRFNHHHNSNRRYDNKENEEGEIELLCADVCSAESDIIGVKSDDVWLIDSGASRHVTFRRDWLPNLVCSNGGQIKLSDDGLCDIKGTGTVSIKNSENEE